MASASVDPGLVPMVTSCQSLALPIGSFSVCHPPSNEILTIKLTYIFVIRYQSLPLWSLLCYFCFHYCLL